MGVRDSYVWMLVFFCLGVSHSYVWGLLFLRLWVRDSYFLGFVFLLLVVSFVTFVVNHSYFCGLDILKLCG